MDDTRPPSEPREEADAHIRQVVDQAPPLSPRQREHLRRIFSAAMRAARQGTEAA